MDALKPNRKTGLSRLQLDVMRVLWDREAASSAEIQAALAPRRVLAQTTVATVLSRLEKRGMVAGRREGRQRLYRARVSESDVRRSMVSELVASLFKGDSEALMTHLLREAEIRPGDLERLRERLERERGDE